MSFESEYNKAMKPLLKKMNKKEAELKALILSSLKDPSKSSVYWNRLRREINVIYSDMNIIFDKWAKKEIPLSYRKSLSAIQASINAKKSILEKPAKTIYQMLSSKGTQATAALLYQTASDTFLSSLRAGQSNVIRFTRATQQIILAESEINLAILTGLSETGNLGKASRVLSGEFWSKMLDSIKNERFIQAGRYKYTPSYYSKMVARTKFHESQSIAAMAQAKNYDTDLVHVSSHNTTTAICIPYEGRVYSINGKSKLFPPLEDTPPYHPNCLHLLFPTFMSGMEAQGTLEGFSDFSKGKIDKPPVPKNFIPVDQRQVV